MSKLPPLSAPPKKQSKATKKTPKKKTTKKKTLKDWLSATEALTLLERHVTASRSRSLTLMPSCEDVKVWFTGVLLTLSRSAGPKARLTLEFARVIDDALKQCAKSYDPLELSGAVLESVRYLEGYVGSLRVEVAQANG